MLLGVGLAHVASNRVHDRALANSGQEAELITRFGITPQISGVDLEQGLAPEAIDALDQLLHAGYSSYPVVGIRIWSNSGRVVYSDDRSVIGESSEPTRALRRAIAGQTVTEVTATSPGSDSHARGGKVIRAYVPLRYGPAGARPEGAFEVHLDYAPVEAASASDTHRLFLVIFGGVLLVWAVLFRIVSGASRRLRRQAAENEHQARHDGLTGLANRATFYEQVNLALARARGGGLVAVMVIDLDRFKEVNDTLGHHSGDQLLREAAGRLATALRVGDLLARLGGDEFAVLLPSIESEHAAAAIAGRLCEAIEAPFLLQDLTVHLEASLGIALHPDHGDDAETLMQRADVAMYVAKASSSTHELWAARYDRNSASGLAILGELRQAIDHDEFELHYQPKADLNSGHVDGVEALVRWRHPERGLIPPDDFIPLAEQTGIIKPLTAWVLETALRQCREWRDAGLELTVAVNLSVRNLLDAQLPETVGELLRRHDLPPTALELEITESTIIADQVRALDVVTRLSRMGIILSIDDFGTGYSSLAYLKDLPVSELKIDRKFVGSMAEDGDDAFIVRSTIDLARNLGLQVVAEGVETKEVWDQLALLGCDVAQGYYLARPLPAEELTTWLRARMEALVLQT